MSFTAQYHSECVQCGESVKGCEVEYDSDHNLMHVICPDDLGIDGKPRPVCPRCFLVLLADGSCGYCDD